MSVGRRSRFGRMVQVALAMALAPSSALAQQGAGLGAAGELVDPDVLRVCADPSSMPSSDQSGEGFENKLAELVAAEAGQVVAKQRFRFVRNTLRANRCDIIMGYAQGDELVQNTNAYYRSTYVLIYKRGAGLDGVETIEDPKLAGKRIGVVHSTPPSSNMAVAGLMKTAKIYPLMIDTRFRPSMGEVMVKDVIDGKIDAAVVWGPVAGYYVKKSGANLAMVPLVKEKTGSRMAYRITMGVRPSDQEWKRQLNRVIKDHQAEINRILMEFNVPLIDEQDRPITQ